MYAVVSLKGHQYIVSEGARIVVDSLGMEDGAELKVTEVLASFDEKGQSVSLGMPYVSGAHVLFTVINSQKGDKIRVVKFKRKNRYERNQGFRPHQTVLEVKKLQIHE